MPPTRPDLPPPEEPEAPATIVVGPGGVALQTASDEDAPYVLVTTGAVVLAATAVGSAAAFAASASAKSGFMGGDKAVYLIEGTGIAVLGSALGLSLLVVGATW